MKLLSNLLKSGYINRKNENKRVIDSNKLVALKLEELAKAEKREFIEGLNAEETELLECEEGPNLPESPEAILKEARALAEEVLEKAKEEAEVIKSQSFSQGKQQGYEAGYHEGTAKINIMKEQLKEKEKKLEQDYNRQLEQIEPLLVDTIIRVFEETFFIQFSDKKDLLLHLVQSAVGKIENSKEFIIKVSREDFHQMRDKKEILMDKVSKAASIEVIEDLTLSKNQCMIETDGGIFDCGLDTQLEGLIKDLRILASM